MGKSAPPHLLPVHLCSWAVAAISPISRSPAGRIVRLSALSGSTCRAYAGVLPLPRCDSGGARVPSDGELARADVVPMHRMRRVRPAGASVGRPSRVFRGSASGPLRRSHFSRTELLGDAAVKTEAAALRRTEHLAASGSRDSNVVPCRAPRGRRRRHSGDRGGPVYVRRVVPPCPTASSWATDQAADARMARSPVVSRGSWW